MDVWQKKVLETFLRKTEQTTDKQTASLKVS